MVNVEFLGPIGLDSASFEVKNMRELKEKLLLIDGLEQWLEISAVAVNDQIIDTLDFELKSGDKVVILPPVCGG